jgi:AraC-like DNA-binding protein
LLIQDLKMNLDNIEFISFKEQKTAFPKHFHETFCISYIHNGIEQIDLDYQTIYSEKGTITITNPYEIHSNPIIDSFSIIEFDTIYISKDLMKYLYNGQNVVFFNRKINNPKLNQLFFQLKNVFALNNIEKLELVLKEFTTILKPYSQFKKEEYSELNFNAFQNINTFIDENITTKFNLDDLSKVVHLNKYSFVKKFKASTGMSPMNYILMKKIFSSKNIITPNSDLTQIAFEYEFSDLAHFSNTFKRYVGISPKMYQKNCTLFL